MGQLISILGLFVAFFAVVFGSGCRKPIGDVRTIDSRLLRDFYFKNGSYWIYELVDSGITYSDSIIVDSVARDSTYEPENSYYVEGIYIYYKEYKNTVDVGRTWGCQMFGDLIGYFSRATTEGGNFTIVLRDSSLKSQIIDGRSYEDAFIKNTDIQTLIVKPRVGIMYFKKTQPGSPIITRTLQRFHVSIQ